MKNIGYQTSALAFKLNFILIIKYIYVKNNLERDVEILKRYSRKISFKRICRQAFDYRL